MMRMRSIGLAVVSMLIGSAWAWADAAQTGGLKLYVGVGGQGDGNTASPLPSIAAARDALRALRAKPDYKPQPVTVVIRAGTHTLSETLEFGPEDGGAADAPVTYTTAGDGAAVISGGTRIQGFKAVEKDGRKLWAAQLPEVKEGQWYFRQLFADGKRRMRTRLPREGFHTFAGLPTVTNETPWNEGQTEAKFRPGDIKQWSNLKDVELIALHFWVESHLPLAGVDEASNRATFAAKSVFRLTEAHDRNQLARYYVENVFEALDAPGEWYLDRPSGTLYYWPMDGETPEDTVIVAPRLTQLVRIVGSPDGKRVVSNLHLQGLTFSHTEWSLSEGSAGFGQAANGVPGAILLERAVRCSVSDCTVNQVSTYGIELGAGCVDNRIINNTLTDLGAGGIKIGHGSTRTTAHNNEIGPGGLIYHSAIGVWIGNSGGNVVTHNHIHHLYYTGVSVGWTWGYGASNALGNIIEYNHIHHIGQGLLSDMGGIYTLGVSPGTRLRYNRIHDIDAFQYGGWGIYNDEGSTNILVENNVVYRTKHGGYHQHYGKENHITNNIFAFARLGQVIRTRPEPHISFIFDHNIVYYNEGPLLGSNWSNDNYIMDYNVYWRTGGAPVDFAGASLKDWRKRGHDEHSIIADPLFVDPDAGDFTLKPDSPAIQLGFRPFDTSRIGRIRE
jgi:parallel beta-helix repeat protein